MSILNNCFGGGKSSVDTGDIANSLRFAASRSCYMSWTPSVASNRKTWTFSFWFKRGTQGATQCLLSSYSGASDSANLEFYYHPSNYFGIGGYYTAFALFAPLHRDTGWHHGLLVVDTTQATATDRIKLYVDKVLQPTSTYNAPTQNQDLAINQAALHRIGSTSNSVSSLLDSNIARACLIDGVALTPDSFVELNSETNALISKKKSVIKALVDAGGANSRMYEFDNATSLTTLGYDYSSKGNNATLSGFSLTAGVNYDLLNDSPSLGNGGRYATWNPLQPGIPGTLTAGNLTYNSGAGTYNNVLGTMVITAGMKAFWEIKAPASWINNSQLGFGVAKASDYGGSNVSSSYITGFWGLAGAYAYKDGVSTGQTTTAIAVNDVIVLAYDFDAGTLSYYVNDNTTPKLTITGISAVERYPILYLGASLTAWANFGQQPTLSPNVTAALKASGFKALCQANLPDIPAATRNPLKHAAVALWAGNSGSQTVGGYLFTPDFWWQKNRSYAYSHRVADRVRGSNGTLSTDLTAAENFSAFFGGFTSDGFSVVNTNGDNVGSLMALLLKAAGAPVTNTQGSITSQVSANRDAGFSIVTWTGTGSNATVGHGLPVQPKLIIIKERNASTNWAVNHSAIWSAGTGVMYLNLTNAKSDDVTFWNGINPTSSLIYLGTNASVNGSGGTFVAYCFADNRDLPGGIFRCFSYTGNGSADGPYVDVGGKALWIMDRQATGVAQWVLRDTMREPSNPTQTSLYADSSAAEGSTTDYIDLLNTGLKVRSDTGYVNASTATFIGLAILATHGKYS